MTDHKDNKHTNICFTCYRLRELSWEGVGGGWSTTMEPDEHQGRSSMSYWKIGFAMMRRDSFCFELPLRAPAFFPTESSCSLSAKYTLWSRRASRRARSSELDLQSLEQNKARYSFWVPPEGLGTKTAATLHSRLRLGPRYSTKRMWQFAQVCEITLASSAGRMCEVDAWRSVPLMLDGTRPPSTIFFRS